MLRRKSIAEVLGEESKENDYRCAFTLSREIDPQPLRISWVICFEQKRVNFPERPREMR